jgi:RNA polymerase sigma-70 factor (ECF subfamily)
MVNDRSNDAAAPPPSHDGARTLVDQYTQRLVALAHERLDPRLRSKLDPSDIVQSVFRTFFRRSALGEFALTDPDSLWPLLFCITVRKCCQQADHFLAARRDVRREHAPDVPASNDVPDTEEQPEASAALDETIEWLHEQLGSDRKRQILDLSLEGYGVVEISAKLGYYERGVERVRAEIRDLLLQLH